ncbi:hypothetical protein QLQ12_31175 [Actinoplanes sp. NEAU-A12]|uniref:Uncharacterized protein n=1 Tax=Actinoplanes sandaracinus TaxID=3045177 RepID=A0ABT6WTW1_9ACTN|nr:hypothetical protein [Actinoplanes sandaracinus]MDI6103086.1 hypothetical protein [Actinoplanes sandaracinus]
MGTWLATVRFPDGAERYAGYSTVVEAFCGPLRPRVCRVGDVLPSGDTCYRDEAVGEPLPFDRRAPIAPLSELVLVTVERQPDGSSWHALYCPSRGGLVGPLSDHYQPVLQEEYDLVRDDEGVRHLCRYGSPPAVCGAEPAGEPLGLHHPSAGMGYPGSELLPDPPPAPDLFAEWNEPDLCRPCFFGWLTDPGTDRPFAEPEPGPPAPVPGWWTRRKRDWQGRR